MFTITDQKGFHITFANGFTVSVQWGPENYCERRDYTSDGMLAHRNVEADWASPDAEVAVIGPDGAFVALGDYDDVRGYVGPQDVAALIAIVSQLPPDAKTIDTTTTLELNA